MLEGLGIAFSPVISAGNWLVILVLTLGGIVTAVLKYGPDRRRAENEGQQIKINEAELIRADYAKQIADFRMEVHGYRNELQVMQGELRVSDKIAGERNDRIATMETIIELLISELERLDPNSVVVKQAKLMMKRRDKNDPYKSDALNAAEGTMRDTEQANRSAKAACREVKDAEKRK